MRPDGFVQFVPLDRKLRRFTGHDHVVELNRFRWVVVNHFIQKPGIQAQFAFNVPCEFFANFFAIWPVGEGAAEVIRWFINRRSHFWLMPAEPFFTNIGQALAADVADVSHRDGRLQKLPRGNRIPAMEQLRAFLNGIELSEQILFAARCGTTVGYLRKSICTGARLGAQICIAIERETHGAIRCEQLRPDVEWAVLRCKYLLMSITARYITGQMLGICIFQPFYGVSCHAH